VSRRLASSAERLSSVGARGLLGKAALVAATALVLWLTREAPGFGFLGPRGELFGWLAYVTAITAALPAAAAFLVVRRPPRAFGLSWGLARRDAVWIGLSLLFAVALAAVVARAPGMRAYYPRYSYVRSQPLLWIPSTLAFAAYGLAWESMFRGFLLFGLLGPGALDPSRFAEPGGAGRDASLRSRAGAVAGPLLVQTLLFVLAHVDKPGLEAWLSIPAGLFFGLAALRTRSVLPGFLCHFTLSTSVNVFCALAF
jgi:hypothetical protein